MAEQSTHITVYFSGEEYIVPKDCTAKQFLEHLKRNQVIPQVYHALLGRKTVVLSDDEPIAGYTELSAAHVVTGSSSNV